ncbi:MAG: SulP family inorganic anion transporter [Proteobacteria bacterium]|nr:SulP family inorganic anion transporter [Pseudomonadota bacterium]
MSSINLKQNVVSGLSVSLIALPLCLAIANASNFPILAGIITAIIGGLLVSRISGSFLAINGPAAGMIVIALDCVERLGKGDVMLGYKATLGAIVVAAILQIITGFTKLPNLMRKFPEEVIRGMMVAIGGIIIIKQAFIIFAYQPPKHSLVQLILDLPKAFLGMKIEVFAISIGVVAFIIFWQKKVKCGFFSKIPVYLLTILLFSVLAFFLDINNNNHYLINSFSNPAKSLFINIPNSFLSAFSLPNFAQFFSFEFLVSVFAIYAVASIETVLSAIAVDKLDPQNRTTNLQQDLKAIGCGNLVCGLVGGLPMITEIVRSSANIKYGASNSWSNFFHGLFLLLFVLFFASFINFIPLCVLASILMIIGVNLINFPLIKKMYAESKSSLFVILTVVAFTIATDLLIGVFSGLLVYWILEKSKKH